MTARAIICEVGDACLDPDVVDGLLAGRVTGAARERAEAHLDVCADCRALVSELARHTPSPTAETLPDASAPRRPGAQPLASGHIGRYEVLRRIGRGGMGVVMLAEDPELKRNVVIKLLRSEMVEHGSQDRERLLREAQAMAKVSHPNVVPIYDVGVHEDRVFLAMEFIDGGDLAAWLRAGPGARAVGDVLRVFRAAGAGLAAAHRVGLVHRDFKPHNVMIGRAGEVKVTDFGLARTELANESTLEHSRERPRLVASDGDLSVTTLLGSPITRSGVLVGTPAYMAPEQIRGEAVDARSDQFSFCVALFEALYGVRPFHGRTADEQFEATVQGRVPEAKRPGVTARVHAAIVRGLSVVPSGRFATMDELLAELAPPRSRRAWVIGAVAGAAALAGGSVAAALLAGGAPAPAVLPARDELPTVLDAWQRVRACLIGERPAVRDLAQAVAARDLVRPPSETCDEVLATLRKASVRDTDQAGVQDAAKELAAAYTVHRTNLAARADSSEALPVAIGVLDGMLARFRAPPPPISETLETLEPEPAADIEEGEPVTFAGYSDGELVVRTESGKRAAISWMFDFPRLKPAGQVWSPARKWHADTIVRGPLARVAIGTTTLARGPAATTKVVAALGDASDRVAVYRSDRWYVARSRDGGRRWASEPLATAGDVAYAVTPAGDRIDLVWWDRETRWLALVAADAHNALPAPRTATTAKPVATCTNGAVWLVLDEGREKTVRRIDREPVARFAAPVEVRALACSADRVIIEVAQEQQVCATACTKLPPAPHAIAKAWGVEIIGGSIVRYAQHPSGRMLAVWRDVAAPAFFGFDDRDRIQGVLDNGQGQVILYATGLMGELTTTPLSP